MPDLVESMKTIALNAVEASKPVAVMFGAVRAVSPLQIGVDQKMILKSKQLIIPRSLAGLAVGDRVILIRQQGGQKFVVLDVIM